MAKQLLKVITISAMCLGMPLLNACSFFRSGENEAVGIKEILVDYDEDGNAIITINYTDKHKEPVSFTLPKGTDGEIGAGIRKVDYEQDEYGATTVTISFTKESMDPVSFILAPGKSISDVKFDTDDEGNTLIIFVDSDGNELSPITVFKGDTGEQGIGIVSVLPDYHADGSITLTITLSDETSYGVEIPAPKEGRGIKTVVSRKEGTIVYLVITYTDETTEEISFEASPTWTTGYNRPGDGEGYDGDYCFDVAHDIIYLKENGHWNIAVDFSTNAQEYSVTFDLNDTSSEPASFVSGTRTYVLNRGETFYSSFGQNSVPIAFRSGYTFGGWSTSKIPSVTSGYFTDLTPVLSDMTLYAVWN